MTLLRQLLAWRHRFSGKHDATLTMQGKSCRRPIAAWVGASCVLVVLLGVMQFAWIARVNDAQSAAIRGPLRSAMRLVIAQLHEEMLLLLTTFDPGADFESARRQALYTERFRSWRQTAMYGRVVKRVLFFDLHASKGKALSELVGRSFTIKQAAWDKDLAPLRKHITKVGLKPGRPLSRKGLVTWMLYPAPLAVFRPVAIPETVPGNPVAVGTVSGYLILQLNQDLIREKLIPTVLDDHLGELAGRARHTVTVAVDGDDVLAYELSNSVESEASADSAGDTGYSLRPLPGPEAAGRPGPADPAYPFLLSSGAVPASVSYQGASQQVALRSPVDILRSIGMNRAPTDTAADFGPDLADADYLFNTPLTVSMGLPRLFVVSERPHRLTIRAGPPGATLEKTLHSEYKRSVTTGLLVLILLVGSMAMVAVSGIRSARRAEMLMQAVASQSHHLRTPLAAITVLADSLASGKLRQKDEVLEHAGLIRYYGQQLNEFVNSTVQLVAAKSSKVRSGLALVDVSAEARIALEEAGPIIRAAGFTAESALAEDLPRIRAEAAVLRRCVGELLRNAVKYGQPGKWLKVETCDEGSGRNRRVRIRIHDRGPGVTRQEARRIFQPYYRAPAVVAQAIVGSGLGLPLVLSSIEEMGGELTQEDGERGGSVFTIHLPVAG